MGNVQVLAALRALNESLSIFDDITDRVDGQ
jgi:hypothetical protein